MYEGGTKTDRSGRNRSVGDRAISKPFRRNRAVAVRSHAERCPTACGNRPRPGECRLHEDMTVPDTGVRLTTRGSTPALWLTFRRMRRAQRYFVTVTFIRGVARCDREAYDGRVPLLDIGSALPTRSSAMSHAFAINTEISEITTDISQSAHMFN
jgi:hypothetical protein